MLFWFEKMVWKLDWDEWKGEKHLYLTFSGLKALGDFDIWNAREYRFYMLLGGIRPWLWGVDMQRKPRYSESEILEHLWSRFLGDSLTFTFKLFVGCEMRLPPHSSKFQRWISSYSWSLFRSDRLGNRISCSLIPLQSILDVSST